MAIDFQMYLVATATTSILWMLYVCWRTYPPHTVTRLAEERPLVRDITRTLWWTSLIDLFAMTIITVAILARNYYGMDMMLAAAPAYMPFLMFLSYVALYLIGVTPATVLFVVIMSVRKVEKVQLEGDSEKLTNE